MAEPKWTDGPWEAKPAGFVGYGHCVVRPAGDAELGNWMMAERIRRLEDANLIAAAPDLYEALEKFSEILRDETRLRAAQGADLIMRVPADLFGIARAALDKARGEPHSPAGDPQPMTIGPDMSQKTPAGGAPMICPDAAGSAQPEPEAKHDDR